MTKDILITKALPDDFEEIHKLEQLCFGQESFSLCQLRYLGTKAKCDFLLTRENGKITSYIILLKRKRSSRMRIYSIAVSPDKRGKGLAILLLCEAEKRAKVYKYKYLTLEVSELNKGAVNLYLKSGFSIYGERLAYYKDGSKAILMQKEITSEQLMKR